MKKSVQVYTERSRSGFTLVELLVVVSIIAILSVIGLVIFTSTQKVARDARRRADIESISKALEVNYNTSAAIYPAIAASWFNNGAIPKDPTDTDYFGVPNPGGATYNVCADLEKDGRGLADGDGTNDFCLSQQQ